MRSMPAFAFEYDHVVAGAEDNQRPGPGIDVGCLAKDKPAKDCRRDQPGKVERLDNTRVGDGNGPESPYALQKYATEIEATLYCKLYNIDTVSLRYFNVYSPDQSADGPYATAIANWMEFIRKGRKPFITGDGEQRRDMLHVSDAVSANVFAMQNKDNFSGAVFDVGTGNNISLNEIKDIVLQYFTDIEFESRNSRPGDIMETKADTENLKNAGWETKVDILEGVEECFSSLREKQNV